MGERVRGFAPGRPVTPRVFPCTRAVFSWTPRPACHGEARGRSAGSLPSGLGGHGRSATDLRSPGEASRGRAADGLSRGGGLLVAIVVPIGGESPACPEGRPCFGRLDT